VAGGLSVERLRVAYGGNVAVSDATFDAPLQSVTGLIGPNGAGKTSSFNACSGLLRAEGTIRFAGEDLTDFSPPARARAGLGRTFQVMQLVTSMNVRDNVALGSAARRAGRNPLRHLSLGVTNRSAVTTATEAALEQCGIADLAGEPVARLSTGQRRLVELARTVAGEYRLLLLDEPSSGLDESETEAFGRILQGLVRDGLGILLVEHDMSLVMAVCEHIFVLDFGRIVFDGAPSEVLASDIVRAAYLGTDDGGATGR
jgi:ABC-type branched-subunit amino acid transport system ATPase component